MRAYVVLVISMSICLLFLVFACHPLQLDIIRVLLPYHVVFDPTQLVAGHSRSLLPAILWDRAKHLRAAIAARRSNNILERWYVSLVRLKLSETVDEER